EEELEQERQRAKRLEELLREAGIDPDENATKV
ncbi:MAG: Uma2 family endonuclease, partial [Symploca sp. SIO1B1]|nr:Uma2 family endonuclease [Symploca sp. SIO1B1]